MGTLANGGVALAPYHHFAFLIPASVRAQIARITSLIERGKIVPPTHGQP